MSIFLYTFIIQFLISIFSDFSSVRPSMLKKITEKGNGKFQVLDKVQEKRGKEGRGKQNIFALRLLVGMYEDWGHNEKEGNKESYRKLWCRYSVTQVM